MVVTSKTNLKEYFNKGDKPTEGQFVDLIDSFIHAESSEFVNITASGNISSSDEIITKNLTVSDTGSFGHIITTTITASTGQFDANTIFIGGSPLSKTDVDEIKEVETKRKSDDGLPIKRLRAFGSASTFVDLNSTAGRSKTKGTAIDIFVKNSYEAFHVDPSLISIGPVPGIPLELTGSVKVGVSQFVPHEFKGKYEFKGNPDSYGSAGDGVVIQDAAFFNDEGGIVVQPGTISQSLNIGTATSPSINVMDGVGNSCFIKIAEGVEIRVHNGSLFKIQCPQPDISVDTDNGTITISDPDVIGNTGDVTIFPNNGGNPTTIEVNTTIPEGQVSYWTVGDVHGTYATEEDVGLGNPIDSTGIQIGALISTLFDGVIVNGETIIPPAPLATSHNVKLRIQDGAELHIQPVTQVVPTDDGTIITGNTTFEVLDTGNSVEITGSEGTTLNVSGGNVTITSEFTQSGGSIFTGGTNIFEGSASADPSASIGSVTTFVGDLTSSESSSGATVEISGPSGSGELVVDQISIGWDNDIPVTASLTLSNAVHGMGRQVLVCSGSNPLYGIDSHTGIGPNHSFYGLPVNTAGRHRANPAGIIRLELPSASVGLSFDIKSKQSSGNTFSSMFPPTILVTPNNSEKFIFNAAGASGTIGKGIQIVSQSMQNNARLHVTCQSGSDWSIINMNGPWTDEA